MTINNIGELPPFFDKYINKLDPNMDLRAAWDTYAVNAVLDPIVSEMLALKDEVYAPEKWTVKQILRHCIDTERIMAYRLLAIGRGEAAKLPGFDEEKYAAKAVVENTDLLTLIDELNIVRRGTLFMLSSFSDEDLLRKGNANGIEISPLSIWFVILGHFVHHMEVVKERYLPLLKK